MSALLLLSFLLSPVPEESANSKRYNDYAQDYTNDDSVNCFDCCWQQLGICCLCEANLKRLNVEDSVVSGKEGLTEIEVFVFFRNHNKALSILLGFELGHWDVNNN